MTNKPPIYERSTLAANLTNQPVSHGACFGTLPIDVHRIPENLPMKPRIGEINERWNAEPPRGAIKLVVVQNSHVGAAVGQRPRRRMDFDRVERHEIRAVWA